MRRCTSALTRLNCPAQGAHYPQGARRIRKAAKPPTAAQGTPLQTQLVCTFLSAPCTNWKCLPEIAPQGHFLALRAQGATAPSGPRNDKAGGFPHSSFFSLQDSFISVPLPHNTRLTALQNFPLSIFDFPRSPILFFSVFLYKYFRIESAKIRKKINKVRKYP